MKWDVTVDGVGHTVAYEELAYSTTPLTLNGVPQYHPETMEVQGVGSFITFNIGPSAFLLKLDLTDQPVDLAQDGMYLNGGVPVEPQVFQLRQRQQERQAQDAEYQRQNKKGMGSLLSFVILTAINLLLIAVDASISFPFSAFVPQLAMAFGVYLRIAPFVAAAVVSAGVYALLYFLGRSRHWPVVVAFALIIIDTLVLVAYGVIGEDFGSMIIDLLFHVWVLASIGKLVGLRIRRSREEKSDLALTAEIQF